MNSLTISLDSIFELTDEKLFQPCQQNRDLRFERGAQGDITIMAPEGSDTGMRNLGLGIPVELESKEKSRCCLRLFGKIYIA